MRHYAEDGLVMDAGQAIAAERAAGVPQDYAAACAEIARLRETLRWYADCNNYTFHQGNDGYSSNDILDDGGEIARRALRQNV